MGQTNRRTYGIAFCPLYLPWRGHNSLMLVNWRIKMLLMQPDLISLRSHNRLLLRNHCWCIFTRNGSDTHGRLLNGRRAPIARVGLAGPRLRSCSLATCERPTDRRWESENATLALCARGCQVCRCAIAYEVFMIVNAASARCDVSACQQEDGGVM